MTTLGCGGGEGDRLGAVSVLDPGAMSVLKEYFVFGMAPEVEAVGDEGVVLGLDELAEEVDDKGRAALAEVLALGGLIVAGGGAGVCVAGFGTGALTLVVSAAAAQRSNRWLYQL